MAKNFAAQTKSAITSTCSATAIGGMSRKYWPTELTSLGQPGGVEHRRWHGGKGTGSLRRPRFDPEWSNCGEAAPRRRTAIGERKVNPHRLPWPGGYPAAVAKQQMYGSNNFFWLATLGVAERSPPRRRCLARATMRNSKRNRTNDLLEKSPQATKFSYPNSSDAEKYRRN
jgi:hypothetical protein